MFKIESYVTPILLSYVDKYVRDFKPADAQVSLWGGGVALHNLVLKADVLQQEVALPFTLVSGRIHELLIQVPWTKIMSEPIVVTIDTIECVLSLNPPMSTNDGPPPDSPSRNTQVVEAPPGYMQALVRRIVSNIALRVHHLIVKYVQDDIVLSLNVKHLAVDSAGPDWEPYFAEIDQAQPVIRRLMRLDDLTLCLDRADADGKIRFYQEPLLYRCQLDLRVLTRLVSANTRRASNLIVQLRSSKLAWGVTGDQLTLLLRLYRERLVIGLKPPTPSPKVSNTGGYSTQGTLASNSTLSNSAEPARSASWSEWAWSWLPSWADREGVGADESPVRPAALPIHFAAYLDDVSLVFKVMELENGTRKRPRVVLQFIATHAAIKIYTCSPVTLNIRFGTRSFTVLSNGKCVCGHLDYHAAYDEPTVYLQKLEKEPSSEEWVWPDEQLDGVEAKHVVASSMPDMMKEPSESQQPDPGQPEEPTVEVKDHKDDSEEFWQKLAPLIYLEFSHERAPPDNYTNPYDSPPHDFQYSDWVEECDLKIIIEPIELRVCMGLLHRLSILKSIYQELPAVPVPDVLMRILTVEECDNLSENLPQRRISVEACGLRVRIIPWDHSPSERPTPPPLVLDLELTKSSVVLNGPLYPYRVCSAACQMPEDSGALWQGARLHCTITVTSVQAWLGSLSNRQTKTCARADIRAVGHYLLNSHFFTARESVKFSYSLKITEANICGSFARLQAAMYILSSLITDKASVALRYTTLPSDALNDDESVAIDLTFEEFVLRGYVTSNTQTHITTLQSAKATALNVPTGESLEQAWVFSAPDAPTTAPYLRLAIQWCTQPTPSSLDYVGIWTEPTAICVDPLFIAWLAYKPMIKPFETASQLSCKSVNLSSTQLYMRRRVTPPSSSGRGASKVSAELVHLRPLSLGSSEKAESRDKQPAYQTKPVEQWWHGEQLLKLHVRLRRMLVNVELGLTLLYVTTSSVSALDCGTVRDAMERHASASQSVLVLSLGRISMYSSTITRHFWNDIKHDGPTFADPKPDQTGTSQDSFPWKMRLADVSCYTLEMRAGTSNYGRDKTTATLRSTLKTPLVAMPRTVLELVTSTVTLSVVTKALQIITPPKRETKKMTEPNDEGTKTRYFTSGLDFKPTTLKEFVRGPAKRIKGRDVQEKKPEPTLAAQTIANGPVVSLGVHLHADTPPIVVRLEHDQVNIVASAMHCFTHIAALLQRPPVLAPHTYNTLGGVHRSFVRSVSETEELRTPSDESTSENRSELISIYEARSTRDSTFHLKTFFWFQWVVSRTTLVAATQHVKLAFDVDDIIATVDLQNHYNQLKVKLASASVRHYEKSGDDWTPGVLGGRVLEIREPTNSKDDNHFLSITITQALISNLPVSWKEELHPKMLEHKTSVDSMWEIYATLAPLEMVLQPKILEQIVSLVQEMAPRSFCPLQKETTHKLSTWQWPFCYVTAGGLRLLLTYEHESNDADDTFMFMIGKVTVSPHPENPICRRTINPGNETGWLTAGGIDGRQYELAVKNVSIRTAQFRQLANQEISEAEMLKSGTSGENPALKWTQQVFTPNITPVLHAVDVGCVLAPAVYVADTLACGPAVELNLESDCAIELSLDQLALANQIMSDVYRALTENEGILCDEEKHSVCPYASLLMNRKQDDLLSCVSENSLTEGNSKSAKELGRGGTDSGVDTNTTSMKHRHFEESSPFRGLKKSLSVVFAEDIADSSEYLEVFVTMGVIEVSLYTVDDNTSEMVQLRPPSKWDNNTSEPLAQQETPEEGREGESDLSRRDAETPTGSKSLTEITRNNDAGRTKLELQTICSHARKIAGNLPLIHVTLSQPNMYYWRKKTQKTLQLSIFNASLGLGAGEIRGHWFAPLLSTARGSSDPLTDIPPALATIKLVAPSVGSSPSNAATRGSARIDVERPVLVEVCTDTLRRLIRITKLIKSKTFTPVRDSDSPVTININESPLLYRLRKQLVLQSIESVTISTSQVAVRGSEGAAGWDSLSLQIGAGSRPDKLCARALLTAAVVSVGPPVDARHVLLQPMMLGMELEATWEAWRRSEGGLSAREPMVRACVDADCASIDLRPADLGPLARVTNALRSLSDNAEAASPIPSTESKRDTPIATPTSTAAFDKRQSVLSTDAPGDHFYKDDLRSGAFKMMSGGQLPMAYQVTLNNNAVSWRYPHPRAITRLVTFPLPNQETETLCVLELYNPLLNRWEAHTHFSIPVGEPIETQLYVSPPNAVFAVMWRFRAYETDEPPPSFEFNATKFLPKRDPLNYEPPLDPPLPKPTSGVTAEQLSGVVRVDSCFSPRVAPCLHLVARLANLMVHLHNDLPPVTSQTTSLEGYYVSKPLMRSHRVLTIAARDASVHANLASPTDAGALLLIHTHLSSDVLDCATGTMEQLIDEFRFQAGISLPLGAVSRSRVLMSRVHAALHVPRLRTLHALAMDWRSALSQYKRHTAQDVNQPSEVFKHKWEPAEVTAAALEGRVSLWIHNSCASALRVGQEGTDEVVPLGPGVRLAYRWRSPVAAKKLRFSIAGPAADWHWSSSIPFTAGSSRVRLADAEALLSKQSPGGGVFFYTKVEEHGARRTLYVAGRLCPANMLRCNLLFKVRIRSENQWRTICSGEMPAESVGQSVICDADSEMALKIKYISNETGWSGDIPLKECPKENVPWLVKVPSEGETPFTCVWCRVIRARSDGRILVTVWPLYVLFSHLPLDTDVQIVTETGTSTFDVTKTTPSVVQATPGRGACSHLLAPGTTAARHSLSFQYREIECPVTGDVIPLHYGVTETSVFEKRAPVASLDIVIAETLHWLERSGQGLASHWPYSVVTKHWPGKWGPAMVQPRSDVTVRYQAVRVGGGCSLEVQLCPVVLLCNAAPIPLTLRAHDAAALCKLEPGTAVSPSSAILKKPFFISVDMGRETFVSSELVLSGAELGRYGIPPRGLLALDHTAELVVQCNHKVALLTMYYEIKEEINVLGISSTYMLVNRMKTEILVSAIAVPKETDKDTVLHPSTYKVVEPTVGGSIHGTPLCRFYLLGRWRGSDPGELRLYLCVTLRGARRGTPPLLLAHPPLRRSLALSDDDNCSVPAVITQIKHEGRWVLTVSEDPCPQLVVHNKTKTTLSVAQPAHTGDEPSTSKVMVNPECVGTRWFCTVLPDTMTHYSTPEHCARYPPPLHSAPPAQTMTFLTFAQAKKEGEHEWCAPVALTDGEQLLQICGGVTVKLRVRTHPHSTHLELRDVDQNDISASDIRRRLGMFSSENAISPLLDNKSAPSNLERIGAEAKLLDPIDTTETGVDINQSQMTSKINRPHIHIEQIYSAVETELTPTDPADPTDPAVPTDPADPTDPAGPTDPADLTKPLATTDSDEQNTLPSSVLLYTEDARCSMDQQSRRVLQRGSEDSAAESVLQDVYDPEWDETASWASCDRLRLVASSIAVELAAVADSRPLIALHLNRAALLVRADARRTKTTISISDVQIDNLQYETGQFDFAVIATTRGEVLGPAPWPPLWNPFGVEEVFSAKHKLARALLRLTHDTWAVDTYRYTELSEIEARIGPLALYIEDAYVTALAALAHIAVPSGVSGPLHDEDTMRAPLRLRMLHVHPLDLTLTLHTAVRMYIALDQSPLRLSTFKLHDIMTSSERLTHELTVHYLSAIILGAGWVVGGLELLGAPGALAARVGGATGGVRGVASTAAAALLRSLSAWAGSLARNLDLLAGDEEHARRAAAARRRPPPSFMAGLAAGITNFAINILGAVGGLAHHPLVGVAVGETESGATALRRGLIGAFAKPLSATADLVAFAGHGLLTQTGWDPIPQPRSTWSESWGGSGGWRRDCVRWSFRLADLDALVGFHVLLDAAPLQLLLSHKFLVVADPESERIVEMIDFRFCSIRPYQGPIIELSVSQNRQSKILETRGDEDDEYQISAAAMARVARYTGAEATGGEARVLSLLTTPSCAPSLHAALQAAIHHNSVNHFPLL